MAYTVKTWDRREIVLSDKQAKQVMDAIEAGASAVRIRGDLYKTSAIAQVTKGGQLPFDQSRAIAERASDRRETPGEGFAKFQELKREMTESTS
ncbi:hypothetical protein [Rhodococcus pyridinivorans]|uniref:hypothetical protein n=1 Tax=Rhodococcus pyridinivorans TaxID=103816 RepID=UPI000A78BCAE|nr:hypothetical protein [Rhodococcus pyridinivorans]